MWFHSWCFSLTQTIEQIICVNVQFEASTELWRNKDWVNVSYSNKKIFTFYWFHSPTVSQTLLRWQHEFTQYHGFAPFCELLSAFTRHARISTGRTTYVLFTIKHLGWKIPVYEKAFPRKKKRWNSSVAVGRVSFGNPLNVTFKFGTSWRQQIFFWVWVIIPLQQSLPQR